MSEFGYIDPDARDAGTAGFGPGMARVAFSFRVREKGKAAPTDVTICDLQKSSSSARFEGADGGRGQVGRHRSRSRSLALACACVLALAGCASVPDAGGDVARIGDSLRQSATRNRDAGDSSEASKQDSDAERRAGASKSTEDALAGHTDKDFWRVFGDPVLEKIIDLAVRNNADVKVASINLSRALIARTSAGLDILPSLGGGLNAGSGRRSGGSWSDASWSGNLQASQSLDPLGGPLIRYRMRDIGVDMGRDRFRDAYLRVVTTAARMYWNSLADNEELSLTRERVKNAEGLLKVSDARLKAGSVSQSDYLTAQQALDDARSRLVGVMSDREGRLASLAVFLGISYAEAEDLIKTAGLPGFEPELVVPDMSADELINRPDVAAAYKTLLQDVAGIEADRRAFFPLANLSFSLSSGSAALGDILRNPASSLGLGVLFPFLDYPRKSVSLKSSKLKYQEDLVEYEKVLRNALKQVEDVRSKWVLLEKRRELLQRDLERAGRLEKAQRVRYDVGADTLQNLLDRRERLARTRLDLLSNRLERYGNFLDQYLAVGGRPDPGQQDKWLQEAESRLHPQVGRPAPPDGSQPDAKTGSEELGA